MLSFSKTVASAHSKSQSPLSGKSSASSATPDKSYMANSKRNEAIGHLCQTPLEMTSDGKT